MGWTKHVLQEWLQLALAPAKLKRLIMRQFEAGAPQHWQAPLAELPAFWRKQLPEIGAQWLENTWQWYQQESDSQRGFWVWGHSHYPTQLAEIANPPWFLCWEGHEPLGHSNQIAVIGSRNASPQALMNTETLTQALAASGLTVTSGMAMGVDSAAHWAALNQGGATCAVLGCGIDACYPTRAKALKKEIQQHGLVVSEYLPGTPAKTEHFPARNRIISGLSRGVLVMAAAQRSGSLITARLAAEQGKDIFAVPYGINDPTGRGCHVLIQQGAKLVTRAEDILEEWPEFQTATTTRGCENSQEKFQMGLEISPMLDTVGFETTSFEQVLQQSNKPVADVMNELVSLEVDGWIKAVPGGYVRVRR
ncbi:DNA-protecting protein DprA [Aliidiomarina taiwanensis]|uniref:DNA-protecting protein DprA n=1 Tax=Aliidiomarina taiwanensis TaxID=946228 RepID=A0A432X8M2_9GAMM|nr:DNA-processing protein DprA [Aliidiomarina taiwanensis]RUO43670.1 DNA-protecting protein DprA [Aliidiomarina taiwanensis]